MLPDSGVTWSVSVAPKRKARVGRRCGISGPPQENLDFWKVLGAISRVLVAVYR